MKKFSTLIFHITKVQASSDSSGIKNESLPDMNASEGFEPPERAVRAILDFACAYEVIDTSSAGKTEWIFFFAFF